MAKNDQSVVGGGFKDGARAWVDAVATQPFLPLEGVTERERVERSIRLDTEYLKTHPLIKPSILITGWVYDLHTGLIEKCE